MFKDPDLFELDRATRQAIYQAAQADLDHNPNLSWRDSILNHAEREFKSRLGGYISHQEHKSEQDSATVLDQADRIAHLLDQVSGPAKENKDLKTDCDRLETYWNHCLADCKNIAELEQEIKTLQAQIKHNVPDGLTLAAIGHAHFGNPIPQAWYAAAKEVIAYICPASQCLVPELDVRKIMLAVEPGPDGTGREVYARSVEDVRAHLTQMGQELEEWRLGVKRLPAPQSSKSLLKQIADLEDSLRAWRRSAELADQDNRRLEQENKELKKEINRLLAAHESTVYFYSLASKKG